MLLESQINEKTLLVFDVEAVATIDKGAVSVRGHPDKVLDSMVAAIRAVAVQMGEAMTVESLPSPTEMELRFALKVDSNAIVSLARNESDGQVQVVLRYR